MIPNSRATRAVAGLLAVGAGVALCAAVAIGAGGTEPLETRSASTPIAGAESKSVRARCRRGSKAVSGGFQTNANASLRPIFAYGSRPGGPRGWTASGFDFGPDDGFVRSFAYCRPERFQTRSASVEVSGVTGSVVARCPRGSRAISGGFDDPDFDGSTGRPVIAYQSRRAGKRRWRVVGQRVSPEIGELSAHVRCARAKAPKVARAQATLDPMASGATRIVARCKRGRRAISGGFESDAPPLPGKGSVVLIRALRKLGQRRWMVSVAATGIETTVTAYAYCERA